MEQKSNSVIWVDFEQDKSGRLYKELHLNLYPHTEAEITQEVLSFVSANGVPQEHVREILATITTYVDDEEPRHALIGVDVDELSRKSQYHDQIVIRKNNFSYCRLS